MAASAPPPPSTGSFSFVSYPTDYVVQHSPYGSSPHSIPAIPAAMSHMEYPGSPVSGPASYPPHYATNFAFAHLGPLATQGPPSPLMAHAHLPPSPIVHHSPLVQRPASPDRYSADTKVMRHILTAMTKMQSTMKDLAERQEQILDRMSLLEQRVGRVDDSVERILDNSEILLEDTKIVRARVSDSESQDAFESRLTTLLDGVVDRLVGGIGDEIQDIKKLVRESDPMPWSSKDMAQRFHDVNVLGEEEQNEVDV